MINDLIPDNNDKCVINALDMRLIHSHSAHTRLYTFSKLKGLMVCLGPPNRMAYIWDVISRVVIGRDPFNVRQLQHFM